MLKPKVRQDGSVWIEKLMIGSTREMIAQTKVDKRSYRGLHWHAFAHPDFAPDPLPGHPAGIYFLGHYDRRYKAVNRIVEHFLQQSGALK